MKFEGGAESKLAERPIRSFRSQGLHLSCDSHKADICTRRFGDSLLPPQPLLVTRNSLLENIRERGTTSLKCFSGFQTEGKTPGCLCPCLREGGDGGGLASFCLTFSVEPSGTGVYRSIVRGRRGEDRVECTPNFALGRPLEKRRPTVLLTLVWVARLLPISLGGLIYRFRESEQLQFHFAGS